VVEDFSSAIRLNPLEVWYYKKRAGTLRHMDEEWKAIDDYSEAIRLDPQDHELYVERATTYRWMSDETYELRNPSGSYLPATARKSKWEPAIEDYNIAIDLAPTHGNYYLWRGISYRELAHVRYPTRASHYLRRAIEDYDQALALGEKRGVYSNRARAYTGLREYEQAIRDFTSAIELGSTMAYGKRGFVYAIMGLDEQAHADFNEAFKTDKNFISARRFAHNWSHHDSEDCFGVNREFWDILCPVGFEDMWWYK
jgi:tetratricopeptide (TPR) repeat protein